MESSVTDHSDRIIHLEQEVSNLNSKLSAATEENIALRAYVDDLVSRSKCQNIRVVGLGKDARQFMTDFFAKVLGDTISAPPELDRAHRSLKPKSRQGQNPHPVIVQFHHYIEKETVLKWAKATKRFYTRGTELNSMKISELQWPKREPHLTMSRACCINAAFILARFIRPDVCHITVWINTLTPLTLLKASTIKTFRCDLLDDTRWVFQNIFFSPFYTSNK